MAETSASDGGGGGAKFFPTASHVARRLCDSCDSAAALLFCRKDAAFLCMACDVKLHRHARHERVWMCEVCEQAPACVTCKADAAALCVTCDRDIHSANPLARRHERIRVVPFYDSAEALVRSTAGDLLDPESGYRNNELDSSVSREDDDHQGWGVPTTTNVNVKFPSATSQTDMKSIDLFAAADRLFDFGFPITKEVKLQSQLRDSVNDGVVPVQTTLPATNFPQVQRVDHHQSPETPYEIDFTRSTTNSNNKSNSQSHNHNVSCSSMDVGVVPEQKSMLEMSHPFMIAVKSGETQTTKKLSGVDREARVLRYREKRKKRKFEKKIRYASRKAYAEMRPRIKGRFAKRKESMTTELDVDGWLLTAECNTNNYGAEGEYGVVPSF